MNKHRIESQARIAALFAARAANLKLDIPPHHAAADSATLHRLAVGESHRAERECNEDLSCRKCGGEGEILFTAREENGAPDMVQKCPRCMGSGSQLGPKSLRAAQRAREIARRYFMRLYEQGDPRGCPYYLIPEDRVPHGRPEGAGEWLASNYSSVGVAVHP